MDGQNATRVGAFARRHSSALLDAPPAEARAGRLPTEVTNRLWSAAACRRLERGAKEASQNPSRPALTRRFAPPSPASGRGFSRSFSPHAGRRCRGAADEGQALTKLPKGHLPVVEIQPDIGIKQLELIYGRYRCS